MRSMTGYSKHIFEDERYRLKIELKSVNNKNLNLKIKLPYILNFLENKVKAEFSKRVSRGSVDLRIDFEDKQEQENLFEYNKNIASSYMQVLNSLEEDLGEKFSNKMDILLKQPNVIKKNETEVDEKSYTELILDNLHRCMDSFVIMKEEEGNRLKDYFVERMEVIEKNVVEIDANRGRVVEEYKASLLEKLSKLEDKVEYSEADILREILLFTDKSDISEEVSRLKSHLEQFRIEIERNADSCGKKLDFILQEIFRELNTSGVKCNLYDISKLVVECKNEVEKIREQLLNIE